MPDDVAPEGALARLLPFGASGFRSWRRVVPAACR